MNRKTNAGNEAFTIVELLVVIVVIGILAAITIVSFNGVSQKAKVAAVQSSLNGAVKKVEIAKAEGGTTAYPLTMTGLDSSTAYTAKASLNGYCLVNTSIAGTVYMATSANPVAHVGPASAATDCTITNLVTNPSFEGTNYNWDRGQRAIVDTSTSYGAVSGSAAGVLTRTSATDGEGYIGTHIATTIGKTYAISFSVKRISGTAPVNLRVVNYNQGWSVPDSTNGAKTVTLTNTYVRYTLTWIAQDTNSFFFIEDTGQTSGTQIAFDAVMATEGDNAGKYVDPMTNSEWGWSNGTAQGYSTSSGPAF